MLTTKNKQTNKQTTTTTKKDKDKNNNNTLTHFELLESCLQKPDVNSSHDVSCGYLDG